MKKVKYYIWYLCKNKDGTPCEPVMYASTNDKKLAKEFEFFRKPDVLVRKITKVPYDKDNFDGDYDRMYDTLAALASPLRKEVLTDGIDVFETVLTHDEFTVINGVVSAIEDLSMENKQMIDRSFLSKKAKKLLLRMNQTCTKGNDGELYSCIDTVSIFNDYFGFTLK